MRKTTSLFVGCILSVSALAATNSWADNDMVTYQVSITNATQRQPFAPIMVATHRAGMSFFKLGDAPSDELAQLAEAGNGKPMAIKLAAMSEVSDAQVYTGGLTKPGTTSTLTIMAKRGMDHISVGAMLGATNDAFMAIADMPLPKGHQKVTYTADVYDAGSETNDELKTTVLGLGGQGYSPQEKGEGFVHVHPGVRGDAELPLVMDWRNPAAEIVIERVSH